ncbi:MAG: geranylgeranyl diphosphate reductase [Pseudomonadota bacterium]
MSEIYDVIVVGGGPSGATAATELARQGYAVALLDRAGRIKPCGGAIPPRLIEDYAIPDSLLVAKVKSARMVAPSSKNVDIPIEGGFVGMVDRDVFDEWLRERAAAAGATRYTGTFERFERDDLGRPLIHYRPEGGERRGGDLETIRAKAVIGADGARSKVGRQTIEGAERTPCVFAYHEIIKSPEEGTGADFDGTRCDVIYNGTYSPDFYSWVFPHGKCTSIGTGSANKGFSLRGSVEAFRKANGMADCETIRKEGAPIPLKPLKRWDNGRDVLLAGDAAGVVAPSSGEGIYYAMVAGSEAALAVGEFLASGDARALMSARKRFMKSHGNVFRVLGMMQHYWYSSDNRRERFVKICNDKDVQKLTFDAYMTKRLVRAKPMAHIRIFFKNIAHLTGLAPT